MSSQLLGLDGRTRTATAAAAASEANTASSSPVCRLEADGIGLDQFLVAALLLPYQLLLHVPGRFRDAGDSRSYTQRHLLPRLCQCFRCLLVHLSIPPPARDGSGPWCRVEAGLVAEIEGVEDVGDAERRGAEDVDGAAGADDLPKTPPYYAAAPAPPPPLPPPKPSPHPPFPRRSRPLLLLLSP